MHGKDEKCIQNFGQKSKGKRHLGDLGVDWMLIFEWVLQK